MAKIYLTQEWLHNLEKELEHLKTVRRVEIAEKLKEAISFWDLSENSEYEDARNEQAQVEHRIADLEEQLKNVEIIEEAAEWWERVNIGSIVEIQNIEKKENIKNFKIQENFFEKIKIEKNGFLLKELFLGKREKLNPIVYLNNQN